MTGIMRAGRRSLLAGAVAAPAGAALAQVPASGAQPAPLQVSAIGSFTVGGGVRTLRDLPVREERMTASGPLRRVDENGDFMVGQMYVQYVKLASPRGRYPLLLWHGGGLTGSCWEDTPDGRPGWQSFFLHAGHDVYTSDAFERGRSGWPRYPQFVPDAPLFRSMQEAWRTFRMGPDDGYDIDPAKRRPYAGSRFPVEALENLSREAVPRWASTDPQIGAAYDAYLQKVGPAVIVAHSQGVNFALSAATRQPDKVAAIICLEGTGAPPPERAALVKNIPLLWIWGDHLDAGPWPAYKRAGDAFAAALQGAGGSAEVALLTERGIHGNTHMLMQDTNSDEIAGMVQGWLEQKGLMKG